VDTELQPSSPRNRRCGLGSGGLVFPLPTRTEKWQGEACYLVAEDGLRLGELRPTPLGLG